MDPDSTLPPAEPINRYPLGTHQPPDRFDPSMIRDWIETLENFPRWLDVLIENLDEEQLHIPYRPDGWSIQQIIHHLADSHMNAYIRLKLALTEDEPVIKPYEQDLWAETAEVDSVPVNISITLLHALHRRMGALMRSMEERDWERGFYHPEQERAICLWEFADHYSWHARHHCEQIRKLRERKGWVY
ncbi:MAG: putative metal-dependent hydrolase [Sphingobacteriales bacterium]|nr:MAG: putative metal-dependent hydrolase [Sphingobacteriales bacterium]